MEKYSKHLEVLVSERTKELMDEQERAATLLYSKQIVTGISAYLLKT